MHTDKQNYESQFTMRLDGRAVNGTATIRALFFSEEHEQQLKQQFTDLGWREVSLPGLIKTEVDDGEG